MRNSSLQARKRFQPVAKKNYTPASGESQQEKPLFACGFFKRSKRIGTLSTPDMA
jgi:hypothetical protein